MGARSLERRAMEVMSSSGSALQGPEESALGHMSRIPPSRQKDSSALAFLTETHRPIRDAVSDSRSVS